MGSWERMEVRAH